MRHSMNASVSGSSSFCNVVNRARQGKYVLVGLDICSDKVRGGGRTQLTETRTELLKSPFHGSSGSSLKSA